MRRRIAILGSTGSIGRSALSLAELYPDKLEIVALAARNNRELMEAQCLRHRPRLAALEDSAAARDLSKRVSGIRIEAGAEGLAAVATHPEADIVLSAMSGAAGLAPTYAALTAGLPVALANKETLVMAGRLIMSLAHRKGVAVLPVDSEHCALHQCLRDAPLQQIRRLVLTASGGPFFGRKLQELQSVTVAEALRHPTWEMGRKVTIDSATLMNKGLEVIEAHHFFQAPAERIDVAIHPQSIVHSIVEFLDGTMLAQLSVTDMRSPILYALSYPERWEERIPGVDLFSLPAIRFHRPDYESFPCLGLAYQALRTGGSAPATLNAANEVAVERFLSGTLSFTDIPRVVERALELHENLGDDSLEVVLETDRIARINAGQAAADRSRIGPF